MGVCSRSLTVTCAAIRKHCTPPFSHCALNLRAATFTLFPSSNCSFEGGRAGNKNQLAVGSPANEYGHKALGTVKFVVSLQQNASTVGAGFGTHVKVAGVPIVNGRKPILRAKGIIPAISAGQAAVVAMGRDGCGARILCLLPVSVEQC